MGKTMVVLQLLFFSLNYYILVGVCEDVIISLQIVAKKDMGNRG